MKINFQINNQVKFAILGVVICSVIIGIIAGFAVDKAQKRLESAYSDFAQQISVNFAQWYSDISKTTKGDNRVEALKEYSKIIVDGNKDIAFIEFKNSGNEVVYSSKADIPYYEEEIAINANAPVISSDNNELIGSVAVGMTGEAIKTKIIEEKKFLLSTFAAIWLAFVILLMLSSFLISRELQKLYTGVKEISTGKFGYKVESDNMAELSAAFNNMSKILSTYEEQNIEQLRLERNKLEAVLMSIINGVIVCDNSDNIVLANNAALSMLDTEEDKLINTNIQDYTDSHNQKCFADKIEEFKDTPLNIIEQKPIEFNIDAGQKTIKAMISPMFSKQQDYLGYIIVLLDITRETEVNKLKNTFISNVSHELRTPVTVLRTYIDTLCNNADDFDEETKKEFMQTIDKEAKRLHEMVNDILDFSRLESGRVNVRKEYANLTELLQQNIEQIKILADEKEMGIIFENPNQKLPQVPLNIESMDRVIRNLLSNAIKYSNEKTNIVVNTGISEDGEYIWFSVKDNGIGIAKENLEKIFERFYRVENATHTVKGTGLGLHLVKMTVEQYHHGKITVESQENVGSTFTVYLPLKIDESELV
ncbi:PAS domain-containing protein [bacterium]|nr:PAS domain-containing protein [bacterium]